MARSARNLIIVNPSAAGTGSTASRNARTIEEPSLVCPRCGARMKLVRRAAPAALIATCAGCAGRSEDA
jgi:hypothetical protein